MPDDDEMVAQLLLLAEGSSDQVVQQVVTDDYGHARIRAFIADVGAERMVELKAEFNQYAAELFQGTGIKAEMTGELPVAYEGMNKLTFELLKSVLTALLFIVITILLVFRDWSLALGSIFPNVLPILLGVGFYALSGQGLNPLPGIAFCIAIGIAVDDTVHLFARFNEEIQRGSSRYDSVLVAVKEVKGALLSSSLILTVGFLMFLYSGFVWNRQLGVLGAFLIVTALLADLLFTPAVLSLKKGKAKNNHGG
jgi:predicted RND superfamily exporter protein